MIIIIIAISLSMDAFSLALAYGTYNFNRKEIISLSIIVGLYHFFMPLIGVYCGKLITSYIRVKPTLIVTVVFLLIGLEMIIDSLKKEEKKKITGYLEMLGFGLAVSIDSFSTGIGLRSITNNIFLSFITFSFVSSLFTFSGLKLGKKINEKIGKISSIIGAFILIIIGISYIFK